MKRQVLEIDKMQHLNELGVDINKASMCWIREPNSDKSDSHLHPSGYYRINTATLKGKICFPHSQSW